MGGIDLFVGCRSYPEELGRGEVGGEERHTALFVVFVSCFYRLVLFYYFADAVVGPPLLLLCTGSRNGQQQQRIHKHTGSNLACSSCNMTACFLSFSFGILCVHPGGREE